MKTQLHPILQEVVSLMKAIQKQMAKTPKAKLTKDELDIGIAASKLGSSQPREVAMSPLMKNALEHYGDKPKPQLDENGEEIKSSWRLLTDMPQTRAEKAIVSNMKQLLLMYNGSTDKFNENLPLDSVEHYNVQCHQNMKDNLRDIQPGQAKQRKDAAQRYRTPTSNTIDQIIRLIETDPVFQKAILVVMEQIPSVHASNEIRAINLPFMTKHTGVGYPYWKNDRTVDPDEGMTYAEITMQDAEKIKDKPNEWSKYNVATMYGRNQRGKGRLIIAVSRVLNLILNQLEAEEIEAYKFKSPLFIGYQDDEALKKALIQMITDCNKYGLKCANEDYSSFDSTVGQGMLVLIGAISIYKAMGSRSKTIALYRAVFSTQSLLVDGLSHSAYEILGRIMSGFIDTNRGGGLVNAIQMTYQCMKQDESYSATISKLVRYMFVMGDDNLHAYRVLDRKKLATGMKSDFGGIINEQKFEFGPTFLQYRVFTDPKTKEYVMTYAWTRVVRSMLMKEEAKGLGPVGWTYAWYQQLWKLYEYTPAFTIAVNLLIVFDENKFFKDVPISQLNDRLKKEDEEALSKLNTKNQKRRFESTWDRLYDGDPSKARFKEENKGLLEKIQAKIREVYDPQFYAKHNLSF